MTWNRAILAPLLLLVVGCAANSRTGASLLTWNWNSRFTRAIDSLLPAVDSLADCGVKGIQLGETVETPYNAWPTQFDIPARYAEIVTWARSEPWPNWGGGGMSAWEWAPGVGLPARQKTWVSPHPSLVASESRSVIMVGQGGLFAFYPDSTMRLAELGECQTAAGGRPVRVLQFQLVGATGSPRLYGVSAIWRSVYARGSLLGLSTSAEGPAEFLTIIQRSR